MGLADAKLMRCGGGNDGLCPAFSGGSPSCNDCGRRGAMFDLIITGGTSVMPASTEVADIGVAGGKIVAIGASGSLAAVGAGRTVDAAGQIVIPGGIDPHIHCGMPIVGGPSNEPVFAA